jgi:hypothetical protein
MVKVKLIPLMKWEVQKTSYGKHNFVARNVHPYAEGRSSWCSEYYSAIDFKIFISIAYSNIKGTQKKFYVSISTKTNG